MARWVQVLLLPEIARSLLQSPVVQQLDARLTRDAEIASAKYGSRSSEARVAWSFVDELRSATRPDYNISTELSREFAETMVAASSYGTFARRRRLDRIRQENVRKFQALITKQSLAVAPLDFTALRPPRKCTTRHREAARIAYDLEQEAQQTQEEDPKLTAVLWDALEEVLASDNSAATTPPIDDQGPTSEDALTVELILNLLEGISWRAESIGAFGNRRDRV